MQKLLQVAAIGAYVLLLPGCASDSVEDLLPTCELKSIEVQVNVVASPGCTDTGEIQVSASGSSDFTFSLDGINFQTSPDFTELGGGNYTVTVMDSEGCTGFTVFDLVSSEGITLSLSFDAAECGTDTGMISANATGGSGDYEFSINGGNFQQASDFSNLAPDDYEVTARDSDGCITTQEITLTTTISLSDDIMPIIEANCALSGCHGNSRSPLMSTPGEVIGAAERIRVRALGLDAGRQPMPPSGFISQELQDQIDCWVNDGALNN